MPKINNLFCKFCKKNYSKAYNYKVHMKNFHPNVYIESELISQNRTRFAQKCPLCDFSSKVRRNVEKHIRDAHQIEEVSCKILHFFCSEEFSQWKNDLEKTTNTIFIQPCGTQCSKNVKTTYYYCSRSGYFTPRGEGKRALRTHGSSKINGICPAKIKKIEREDEDIEVHYIDFHLGHENELHHLHLKKEERDRIASKIAQNISFDNILLEIRQSVETGERIDRLKLLTKKDLWNIKSSYTNNETLSHMSVRLPEKSKKIDENSHDENLNLTECISEDEKYIIKCDNLTEQRNKFLNNFTNILNQISKPEHFDILEKGLHDIISKLPNF